MIVGGDVLVCSHLGFIESVDKHFVIKNISFRVKQ